MVLLDAYPVQLLLVALAGLVVHEATHYVTCRLFGARARPSYAWGRWLPNPAIRVELRDHTPETYRMVCLAPLVVSVPSLLAAGLHSLSLPPGSDLVGLWFMWCLATIPSPPDWRQAYHAADIGLLQRGWFGRHPNHEAAEGI